MVKLIHDNGGLVLPFKPFTLDEVRAVTGIASRTLDAWVKTVLPLKIGDDRVTHGLNDGQMFAAFVGWRWLEEGADPFRATSVVQYLASVALITLGQEIERGRNFPATKEMGAEFNVLVPAPDTTLGRRLRLDKLYAEFLDRLHKVFPKG